MNSFKHGATMRNKSRNIIGGLAMLAIGAVPLQTGELRAKAGESIDLGRFHGVVYYTSEDDGYRVVATIADGEAGSPLRFSTTLADNQSATISLPGIHGEPGHSLRIRRSGGKLMLSDSGPS